MNTARTTDEALAVDETAPNYITKQDVINLWKSRFEAASGENQRLDAINADLLAALKDTLDMWSYDFEQYCKNSDTDDEHDDVRESWARAEHAIAKAEGREDDTDEPPGPYECAECGYEDHPTSECPHA